MYDVFNNLVNSLPLFCLQLIKLIELKSIPFWVKRTQIWVELTLSLTSRFKPQIEEDEQFMNTYKALTRSENNPIL